MTPADPRREMHVDIRPALTIASTEGHAKGVNALSVLGSIYGHIVSDVLASLAPFLHHSLPPSPKP